MPRTCSADGCNNSVFSHGFCKFHGFRRRMFGGDLYNTPKKPSNKTVEALSPKSNTIHRRAPKRASDERYYTIQAKEFFDDAVKDGTNNCFFCGERVLTFQGLHHVEKRDGSKLNDFTKIVIVHNVCHLFFHSATLQQLKAKPWFKDWMGRLKSISIEAYNKELRKAEKTINLFDDEHS